MNLISTTQPREHCGELAPSVSLIGQGKGSTECVLRPGHTGSHAADNGMRWTLAASAPVTDQPARLGPIDYARQQEAEREAAAATELPAEHCGDTITSDALDALYNRLDYQTGRAVTVEEYAAEQRTRAEQAEAELKRLREESPWLKATAEDLATAQAAIARVRAECDRIEAAVRANPQDPDFDGAYLAAIGHIRNALNPQEES